MAIDSICSGCGKTLRVGDENAGRKARCPMCGVVYVVSSPAVPSEADYGSPLVSASSVDPTSINDASNTDTTYASTNWSSNPFGSQLPSAQSSLSIGPALPAAVSARSAASFLVRTPSGAVYGPTDPATIIEWTNQGRLDDTCHVRAENSEQWLGMAAWRFQLRQNQNPMASQPTQTTGSVANSFGQAPVAANQSAGYARSGQGGLVLIFGIVSWLLCPTFIGSLALSIVAVVWGSSELRKIRDGQSPASERSLVLIGMWLGIINLAVSVLAIVGIIILAIVNP